MWTARSVRRRSRTPWNGCGRTTVRRNNPASERLRASASFSPLFTPRHPMKLPPRLIASFTLSLFAVAASAQINNNPPGTPGRGRGPGVEASVVTANARSPEVNANGTITFRLLAPNAKKAQVFSDIPKLGEVTVHGSAGYDMTKDENGVWSY